ncbi:TPA: hypothetical protein DIC62_00580 [Candidatus Nomurabacteria bacterium]|nr:hypothetical protein [Candidatus Nomurabacteria bacterium]
METQIDLKITNQMKKEEVKILFLVLWDILELSESGRINPNYKNNEKYRQLYFKFGHILLGNECPEREVKC